MRDRALGEPVVKSERCPVHGVEKRDPCSCAEDIEIMALRAEVTRLRETLRGIARGDVIGEWAIHAARTTLSPEERT